MYMKIATMCQVNNLLSSCNLTNVREDLLYKENPFQSSRHERQLFFKIHRLNLGMGVWASKHLSLEPPG